MRTPHTPPHSGFTLVEVMVALAILTLGLLGVATMISRSTIQDARAYYLTQASMIVEEFIENATQFQYPIHDPISDKDISQFHRIINSFTNRTIDGVTYILNCTVVDTYPIIGCVDCQCKEMTCIITWNNKGIPGSTQNVFVYTEKIKL